MNCKAKGTRNEHRSMAYLAASGYYCSRSAGSLGAWDIFGISKAGTVLCQVKTNCWPGAVEMETLRMFEVPFNCKRLIHRWRDHQRKPDVKEL